MRTVHEFIRLREQKLEIEASLKKTNAQLAAAEEAALEYMAGEGLTSMRVDDKTVYQQKTHYASLKADKAAAIAAIKASGLTDMVQETVNAQTLSAWVREQEGIVPSALEPHISVYEQERLRVRSR